MQSPTKKLDELIALCIRAYSKREDLKHLTAEPKKEIAELEATCDKIKQYIAAEVMGLRQRILAGDNIGNRYLEWAILNYGKMPFMYRDAAQNAQALSNVMQANPWALILEEWKGWYIVNPYTGVIDEIEEDYLLMRVGDLKLDVVPHHGFRPKMPLREPNLGQGVFDAEMGLYQKQKEDAEKFQRDIIIHADGDIYAAEFPYSCDDANYLPHRPNKHNLWSGAAMLLPVEVLLLLKQRNGLWLAENLSVAKEEQTVDSSGVNVFHPETLTNYKIILGEERVKHELGLLFGTQKVNKLDNPLEFYKFVEGHNP